MSKEIEEMAKIMCQDAGTKNCNITCNAKPICDVHFYAERLYKEGYRKQRASTVELPFKVGDTVYVPWSWAFQKGVATVKVEEIKFYDTQMHYMFLIDMESDNECFNQSFGGWKTDRSVGTTVFLTKEEAEAKMRGGE